MSLLQSYFSFLGQQVNTSKTSFIAGTKNFDRRTIIKGATGFRQQVLPFIYLGCPIYKGRVTRRFLPQFLLK